MKKIILNIELLIQIAILIYSFQVFFLDTFNGSKNHQIASIMVLLALANFGEFVIRLFTHRSALLAYYFFGVIAYISILVIASSFTNVVENIFFDLYFYGGSIVLSLFYTVSGFFILKEIKANS